MNTLEKIFKQYKLSREMYTNELTQTMDSKAKYLGKYDCTYVYVDKDAIEQNRYLLRFPGLTVGYFSLDVSYIITEIHIYESVDIYDNDINDAVKQFIGWKFLINEKD